MLKRHERHCVTDLRSHKKPLFATFYWISFAFFCFVIQRFQNGLKPEFDWGPALQKHRLEAGYPLLPDNEVDEEDLSSISVPTKKMNGESYEMINVDGITRADEAEPV